VLYEAEALDTGSAAGRLVITIMGAVSQWEREAIGERTRDALRHKRGNGERIGNISRRIPAVSGSAPSIARPQRAERSGGDSESCWASWIANIKIT
jgi:DNA invertase Pin-like site-specific DNA recombinase